MNGEFALLEALRGIATHPAARGLNDDAAVLEFGGETLVITHDAMAEGVHYFADADMADVAYKLVAVNLSDLAAKGAEPVGILLEYSLGRDDARFLEGLHEALDEFGVPLLGGDTITASGPRSFGLTALGRATHVPVPSRAGAAAGDGVFLCGTIGAAMLGYETLRDGLDGNTKAFRRPTPLLAEGAQLAPLASAMMDVSDGLLLDASRLAGASKVTLALTADAVPLACPDTRRDDAMRWGDDYALLLTAPLTATIPDCATRIGTVEIRGDHAVTLNGEAPATDRKLGYTHS